ncbi:hypothetical protein H696_04126 [Fonticula alba]|uniref:Septum formation protein n=1 Tax=Fonticula alba TaxID=691883 RepID=A0A058Z622_FONAL|nr:hypothetical protein H696_04126 [Fonticula alba]KCV69720.1 hypothetical protein H696_04126 [Fonticula alba]|eukprot:XP_009496285.1 hypothetical protein H696_04126 [Fonticula alba]
MPLKDAANFRFILGSKSPRRIQLLGEHYPAAEIVVQPSAFEEDLAKEASPTAAAYVSATCWGKMTDLLPGLFPGMEPGLPASPGPGAAQVLRTPAEAVARLAGAPLPPAGRGFRYEIVICADTVVVLPGVPEAAAPGPQAARSLPLAACQSGDQIVEKPADEGQAFAMIRTLCDRGSHMVLTAVACAVVLASVDPGAGPGPGRLAASFCHTFATGVDMCPASDDTIRAFIAQSHPYDKAGGYDIQSDLSRMIIRGSRDGLASTVIGFPIEAFAALMDALF